jgi:hypothetical protein
MYGWIELGLANLFYLFFCFRKGFISIPSFKAKRYHTKPASTVVDNQTSGLPTALDPNHLHLASNTPPSHPTNNNKCNEVTKQKKEKREERRYKYADTHPCMSASHPVATIPQLPRLTHRQPSSPRSLMHWDRLHCCHWVGGVVQRRAGLLAR